ncbi:hypothetical protein MJO28_012850 [Puccinia striiformis f. sp. tritici]|uniref:Uncharacterized protein n=1 Tax=Puccinia striiformis f. sp. tritici TaxID=168172 RepID=A0ACC0DXR6_9BASI|nr:hypothetical protein MJO28_012850 [Puccinia striiformis f. sp. tritici]
MKRSQSLKRECVIYQASELEERLQGFSILCSLVYKLSSIANPPKITHTPALYRMLTNKWEYPTLSTSRLQMILGSWVGWMSGGMDWMARVGLVNSFDEWYLKFGIGDLHSTSIN